MIFESTKHFGQSEIHPVIPLLRKILCDKSAWNGFGTQADPEGVKYRDVFHQSNLGVIISPPGKTGGLVFVSAALERKAFPSLRFE